MDRTKIKTSYPVLVDDIDNHDELPIVFSEVDESHSSYLDVSLENLHGQSTIYEQNCPEIGGISMNLKKDEVLPFFLG